MAIGRNDPCSCGSGLKYKKCCLNRVFAYTLLVTTQEFESFSCWIKLTHNATLYSLHRYIQDALRWDNDHMFSFFMDNKMWSRRSEYSANPYGEGNANICLRNVLKPKKGEKFIYLFDYGDEHRFDIEIIDIEKVDNLEAFTDEIVKIKGELPTQYQYFEEEDVDCLITDIETIERIAIEKREENLKFRSFLKMYDGNVNIDELIHAIASDVSQWIDCLQCANCCKKSSPILTESDIAQLSCSLKNKIEMFKDRYLKKDGDSDFIFNTTPCPLLEDKRCLQYDCRPDDCKSFPHLHKDKFLTRLLSVVENYHICPIVFNSYEQLKKEFTGWQNQTIY